MERKKEMVKVLSFSLFCRQHVTTSELEPVDTYVISEETFLVATKEGSSRLSRCEYWRNRKGKKMDSAIPFFFLLSAGGAAAAAAASQDLFRRIRSEKTVSSCTSFSLLASLS